MLTLHLNKTADVIMNNEKFFIEHTSNKPDLLTLYRNVILGIEGLSLDTEGNIKSKFDTHSDLQTYMLSTGCRTVLNILSYPNIIFTLEECGPNALIAALATDGNAYLRCLGVLYELPENEELKIAMPGETTVMTISEVLEKYA